MFPFDDVIMSCDKIAAEKFGTNASTLSPRANRRLAWDVANRILHIFQTLPHNTNITPYDFPLTFDKGDTNGQIEYIAL